jgi:hypothetical protein
MVKFLAVGARQNDTFKLSTLSVFIWMLILPVQKWACIKNYVIFGDIVLY